MMSIRGLVRFPLDALRRVLVFTRSLWGMVVNHIPILTLKSPPPIPQPKTLLLVRHGQSMHNISDVAQFGDQGADATLYDAPLSPLGHEQVAALAGHELLAKAEFIICSPLTRAIQTMYGAFPPDRGAPPAPVELWPLAAEHLTDSCDIGSGAAEIGRKFSSLDVSKLPEVWWYTDEETSREDAFASRERYREYGFMEPELTLIKRVDAFVAALRQRPERVIAIFGHSDFFNFVMERHGGVLDYWLENAEVYPLELPLGKPEEQEVG